MASTTRATTPPADRVVDPCWCFRRIPWWKSLIFHALILGVLSLFAYSGGGGWGAVTSKVLFFVAFSGALVFGIAYLFPFLMRIRMPIRPLDEVIRDLSSTTTKKRRLAATYMAMAEQVDAEAVPALAALLRDSMWYIRSCAASALSTAGGNAASALLMLHQLAESDPHRRVRKTAARAVGLIELAVEAEIAVADDE